MKLKQLREIQLSLRKLLDGKLDIYVAYKLKGFTKFVKEELESSERVRIDLIDKYAKKEDGKLVIQDIGGIQQVLLTDKDAFEKEWNAILDTELDFNFDSMKKITLEQIESFNKHSEQAFQFSPVDICNLEFMIEEPKDGK